MSKISKICKILILLLLETFGRKKLWQLRKKDKKKIGKKTELHYHGLTTLETCSYMQSSSCIFEVTVYH